MNTRSPLFATSLALVTALAGTAAGAASVEVRFVQPEKFSDVGRGLHDRSNALAAIEQHLKQLGQRLSEGQTLTVEVTDVDLAGEMRWLRRGDEKRILRGRADWPRMSLKYTLASGSQTLKSGEERLSDMSYLERAGAVRGSSAYVYDLRMVEDWFGKTFAAELAAAAAR